MIRSNLPSEILARYSTDKDIGVPEGHNYGKNFYDIYLPPYRWCEAVLELGIEKGESLRAWREYFPEAKIVGVDCSAGKLVFEDRIHSAFLDCSDKRALEVFALSHVRHFSVIIDDASHIVADQVLSLQTLKKCLTTGGIYIIEDVSSVGCTELSNESCKILEWDTDKRADNRIAFFINV